MPRDDERQRAGRRRETLPPWAWAVIAAGTLLLVGGVVLAVKWREQTAAQEKADRDESEILLSRYRGAVRAYFGQKSDWDGEQILNDRPRVPFAGTPDGKELVELVEEIRREYDALRKRRPEWSPPELLAIPRPVGGR